MAAKAAELKEVWQEVTVASETVTNAEEPGTEPASPMQPAKRKRNPASAKTRKSRKKKN